MREIARQTFPFTFPQQQGRRGGTLYFSAANQLAILAVGTAGQFLKTGGAADGTTAFSAEGANAYYPYTLYTCPHPLTGYSTGSCIAETAGTAGYVITGAAQNSLGVSKVGNGTVTSSPAGINCGAICGYAYDDDTEVTLTGTPDTGYDAATFSGDCSAAGVVTLSTDKNCIVTFNKTEGGGVGTGASFKLGTGASFKLY